MIITPCGMKPNGQFVIANPDDSLNAGVVMGRGGTPTLAVTAAAGTGATFSIVGTNLAGKITLTTGISLLATGKVLTLTFADGFVFPTNAFPLFAPADSNFASVFTKLYALPKSDLTGIDLYVSMSLSLGTTYTGNYGILGF